MKNNIDFLTDGIGLVDDDLLKESETPLKSVKAAAIKRILPLAACFLLLCGILTASLVIGKKAADRQESAGSKTVTENDGQKLNAGETPVYDAIPDALIELFGSCKAKKIAYAEEAVRLADKPDSSRPTASELKEYLCQNSILSESQPDGAPYLILGFSDGSAYLPLTEDEFSLLFGDLKTTGSKTAFKDEWRPAVPVLLADGNGKFYSPYIENAADNALTEPKTPAFEVFLPSLFEKDAVKILEKSIEE